MTDSSSLTYNLTVDLTMRTFTLPFPVHKFFAALTKACAHGRDIREELQKTVLIDKLRQMHMFVVAQGEGITISDKQPIHIIPL